MSASQHGFSRMWLPVPVWMLVIFILSSVPGPDIPDLPIPDFHKVVHFFEYSVLGGLWVRALLLRWPGTAYLRFSILAWFLTAAFAFSDEWHQTFVSGRSGRLEDVFFDMICSVLGILFYICVQEKLKQRKSRGNDLHA